ncbi:MAG: hypothetical protein KDD94_13960, partial [Calditrichaeota bacterium]|nr:hypothetical protein [Calditrichota bacterium]
MYDLHEARQKERDKITEYENTNFESGVSVFDVPQEVAELAYRNTSFNPDGAGRRTRIDYVDSIESIYQELKKYGEMHGTLDILVSEFPRLLEGAKRRILDAINADSRCASTMITGPSNFPADRNRKRMDAAMKRWGEYRDYKSKAYEAIKNKMTPAYLKAVQSGQEGGLQILKDRLATAEELQRHMKEVNKIIRGARGDKHKMLAELKKITIGARFLSDKELD